MTIAPLTGQFYVSPFGMTDARGVEVTGVAHEGDAISRKLDSLLIERKYKWQNYPSQDGIDDVCTRITFCQII